MCYKFFNKIVLIFLFKIDQIEELYFLNGYNISTNLTNTDNIIRVQSA